MSASLFDGFLTAAALLSAMGQQHERGLGNWQAELAEWPGLFLSAHGALSALNEAMAGLQVDAARMRDNIDALSGLVFGEAVVVCLAPFIGRVAAQAMVEKLSRASLADNKPMPELEAAAIDKDARLRGKIDPAQWLARFDPVLATGPLPHWPGYNCNVCASARQRKRHEPRSLRP